MRRPCPPLPAGGCQGRALTWRVGGGGDRDRAVGECQWAEASRDVAAPRAPAPPPRRAVYTGFTTLPWLLKPLYGFASDTFPILGSRRRAYLVLCGALGSAAWGGLAASHPSAPFATALLILGSAGTACSDVVVDSIVVEASRNRPTAVAGAPRRAAKSRKYGLQRRAPAALAQRRRRRRARRRSLP